MRSLAVIVVAERKTIDIDATMARKVKLSRHCCYANSAVER